MSTSDDLEFTVEPQLYQPYQKTDLYFCIRYSILHINLTFSEDGSEPICILYEDPEPRIVHFWSNIGLFNGDREALDIFSECLSCLGFDSEFEQIFVSEVIQRAKRFTVVQEEIRHFNLNVRVERCYYPDEVYMLEMQSMAEYEERNYGMVPADPSSLIGMMKSVKLEDKCEEEEGEICSVCLEEVVDIASAMPCAHVFHENCILKWLQTSHVCPVCRFPMPVE
ncbi:RING/U-box superfamily protein [Euphorbia peplus]|nr:RING/U-box superfamily protein [Euphorbia peplus]